MSPPLKILVVDQIELVAAGLKEILSPTLVEIVGYCQNGKQVLEWLSQNQADIVLLDVSLPEMDGIDTTRAVHAQFPDQILVAHSRLNEIEYINSMLIEGASAYILKGAESAEYEKAFELVIRGKQYLSPAAEEVVKKGYTYTDKNMDGEYLGLTVREREIIRRVALEQTNQEIADDMFLSIETIRTYRKSLMTKLDIKTAGGLVKYALDRRWI